MTFAGLVPDDFEEFRSVKFWDGFFEKRKQRAFEWYGEWRQLQPLVWGACARPNKQILMLGCGNSDLSAQMYDAGCRSITNIDFSKVCIKEMLMKNLRQRPQMKWLVMDMTQLKFKDGSFHIAFDKGALDALMGEDTDAASTAGSKLLSEVQRVLDPSEGQYICVTLGQPHVLNRLLASFGSGWSLSIDRVPPSPDMASSPLQPFLVIAARCSRQTLHTQETDGQIDDLDDIDLEEDSELRQGQGQRQHGASPKSAPAVQLSFKADTQAVNGEQLADIIKIVHKENLLRASGGRSQAYPQPAAHPTSAIPAARPAASPFDQLQPGRCCLLALPQPPASPPGWGCPGHAHTHDAASFTAAVLDVDAATAKQAVRDCAVFIVPQGREHEWLFTSPEGQGQVAQGCCARRVIVVFLNRGHVFSSLKAVQAELSPLVVDLAPKPSRHLEAAIPFMTTQEGIGNRTVVEEAASPLTGHISIEDVTVQGDDGIDVTLRRMVFTNNRNLIQSEAVLCPAGEAAQVNTEPTASAANGQQGNAVPKSPIGKMGKAEAKSAKRKAKAGAARQNSASNPGQQQPLVVDHTQLACDYHKGIVAGLSLIQPHLSSISQTSSSAGPTHHAAQSSTQQQLHPDSQQQQQQSDVQSQGAVKTEQQQQQPQQQQQSQAEVQSSGNPGGRARAMVVGLGGGGLPVFLNRHCHMDVQAVELDPVVVDLARRHFGFADSASLRATVGDGLQAVAQLAQRLNANSAADAQQAAELAGLDSGSMQSPVSCDSPHSQHLDLLVVDAGSGDASVAMSCPPAPFLESTFLGDAKQALKPGGMLAVNCVSRAAEPYRAAVETLQVQCRINVICLLFAQRGGKQAVS
ncbi:hypothetical protein ABBQ32_006209 [Trebouxia sp. C0010 RCD-2024]